MISRNLNGVTAAADLSSSRYLVVKRASDTTVNVVTAITDVPVGVLQSADVTSGLVADVLQWGQGWVKAGEALNAFQPITFNASGAAVAAGVGQTAFGVTMEPIASGAYGNVHVDFVNASGASVKEFALDVPLAGIVDGDVLTAFTIGVAGRIIDFKAIVTSAVTTAAKATTLNLEIGTTNVTGGVLALTSANCTPIGTVLSATAITAANEFSATDTISIEATSTTAFVEGQVSLRIRYV